MFKRNWRQEAKSEIDQSLSSVMPKVLTTLIAEYAQPTKTLQFNIEHMRFIHSHFLTILGASLNIVVLWCPICEIQYWCPSKTRVDEKNLIPAMPEAEWRQCFVGIKDDNALRVELVQPTPTKVFMMHVHYFCGTYSHIIREFTSSDE